MEYTTFISTLAEIGLQLGAGVLFCIWKSRFFAEGVGEKLYFLSTATKMVFSIKTRNIYFYSYYI